MCLLKTPLIEQSPRKKKERKQKNNNNKKDLITSFQSTLNGCTVTPCSHKYTRD